MFKKDIIDDKKWMKFLESKISSEFVSKIDKKELEDFILNKRYTSIVDKISNDSYNFSVPFKHVINKGKSRKKRVVYSFSKDEMNVLKYIAFLLYQYDYLFQNNLYSFRKNISVKTAIKNISNIYNINNMYGYKVDIKNYFNSIDVDVLLNNLRKDIDYDLYKLIEKILLNKNVLYNGVEIEEKKGVMAGIPISAFLANYYIKEIDEYFNNEKLVYLRYSDDIIIFCNTKEDIIKYSNILNEMLRKYKLDINNEKEHYFEPGDKWEFLGFSFENGVIDLSSNTLNKIKKKIRRSSRSIRRWMIRKNVSYDKAIKVIIKKYNKKFYGINNIELSWMYWFFPVINTTKSLKVVDKYFQDNLRFIATGKHNKKNYKIVPYNVLKDLGYKSLVHEYYLFVHMKSNV